MYRHRDIIEKEFKFSKSGMDLTKLYATSNESLESKTFLLFIGVIYRTIINKKCDPYFFQYISETTQTVLLELNKIKIEKLNNKYVLKYALINRQSQILSNLRTNKKDIFKAIDDFNISYSTRDVCN